jgi:hypothetical protein
MWNNSEMMMGRKKKRKKFAHHESGKKPIGDEAKAPPKESRALPISYGAASCDVALLHKQSGVRGTGTQQIHGASQ